MTDARFSWDWREWRRDAIQEYRQAASRHALSGDKARLLASVVLESMAEYAPKSWAGVAWEVGSVVGPTALTKIVEDARASSAVGAAVFAVESDQRLQAAAAAGEVTLKGAGYLRYVEGPDVLVPTLRGVMSHVGELFASKAVRASAELNPEVPIARAP